MKTIAKLVVLSLVLAPLALVAGCGKKCCDHHHKHRYENMNKECGGK